MPTIFGDHMVLQQGTKLPVWGTAAAGEKVTVTVGTETGSATAGADGKWRVTLAPLPAGTAPVTMTVAGKNTLTFSDVLVGDVWICSGQSNMQFALGGEDNATAALAAANQPLIRLFTVPDKTALTPNADIPGAKWEVCTPDTAKGFTAVGYHFGLEIQKMTGQPVGLIHTSWGGTPAQAWTSIEKLQSDPVLKHYADDYAKLAAAYPQAAAAYPAAEAAFRAAITKWRQDNGLPENATAQEMNAANAKAAAEKRPQAPKLPTPPDGGAHAPSILFNSMIAPLIPYAIKGAIWYQGESNAGAGLEYATLFPAMITDWRARWGEGDFPFLWVQLAKYTEPNRGFALIREAQLKTLALPKTGMAVAFDIGDQFNIHPKDKADVGHRLALAAKHVAYGQDLVYSGPIYAAMKVEGATVHVSFTQVGGGLIIGKAPWVAAPPPPPAPVAGQPVAPAGPLPLAAQELPTTTLVGFTLAGTDQKWMPADARIEGNEVVVSSAQVAAPVAVRYAVPLAAGNLYNKEGLPASPFRSDDWELVPPKPKLPPAAPAPAPAK